jgi:hypothetical protein
MPNQKFLSHPGVSKPAYVPYCNLNQRTHACAQLNAAQEGAPEGMLSLGNDVLNPIKNYDAETWGEHNVISLNVLNGQFFVLHELGD